MPDERPWRVVPLAEFETTWRTAAKKLSRPDHHRAAIERAVSRGPIKTSSPVGSEATRLLRISDPLDGYELWVYFRMLPAERVCELGWVRLNEIRSSDLP